MSAYLVAMVDISDPIAYRAYAARSRRILAEHGGEILARGGEVVTLEGQTFSGRAVVIRFPTLEHAQRFYASPEYQEARRLREHVASARIVAVQGVD